MSDPSDLPEWERLLAAERHLQSLVPGSVLVGGRRRRCMPATAGAWTRTTWWPTCDRFDDVLAASRPRPGGRRRECSGRWPFSGGSTAS